MPKEHFVQKPISTEANPTPAAPLWTGTSPGVQLLITTTVTRFGATVQVTYFVLQTGHSFCIVSFYTKLPKDKIWPKISHFESIEQLKILESTKLNNQIIVDVCVKKRPKSPVLKFLLHA